MSQSFIDQYLVQIYFLNQRSESSRSNHNNHQQLIYFNRLYTIYIKI
ncbi:hypothetical protein pb186bvf_002298 [Paramecium bursaria]